MPYAELSDPQTLNLYVYGWNNPVTDVDADGHTPIDWIWEQSGYMEQEVGFGFHLWAGAAEGKTGNCGEPCVVRATGGRVSLLSYHDGLGASISDVGEQLRSMLVFPASIWWRGWVNFFVNGKAIGAGQMALAVAAAFPGDEEVGVAAGLTQGGRRQLGSLAGLADKTVAEAIRLRGGGAAQLHALETGMGERLLSEVANAAADGDRVAVKAIKMVKQAAMKASRRY